MSTRRLIVGAALVAATAAAETTAREWLTHVLDPSTVGVPPAPGAELNRKLSVDALRFEHQPAKQIAVYLVPQGAAAAAAQHFATQLHVTLEQASLGKAGDQRWFFACRPGAGCPATAGTLSVAIFPSPWADGRAQIQMEIPGDPEFSLGPLPPVYP